MGAHQSVKIGLVIKVRILCVIAALAFFTGTNPSSATPLALVDRGASTYDPNTNLVWLDLSVSASRSFDYVQTNLIGFAQPFALYRYATVTEVQQLFVDAGISNFSPHGAGSAIANLVGLLGPTFLPAPSLVGLGGMTADELSFDPTRVLVIALWSGTDALNNSFAGLTGSIAKSSTPAADTIGSFLVRDALNTDDFLHGSQTPLPAALPLFASGGALLGFLGWRRKRKLAV